MFAPPARNERTIDRRIGVVQNVRKRIRKIESIQRPAAGERMSAEGGSPRADAD